MRGEILYEIVRLAKGFKDHKGHHFSAILIKELLMGRLAELIQKDKSAASKV